MKKIVAWILSLMILMSCAGVLAEKTTVTCYTIPELASLGLSYEEGDDHWTVGLYLGDTELFSFGVEKLGERSYIVSSLLPNELSMDDASIRQITDHSSVIRWIASLFPTQETLSAEDAQTETSEPAGEHTNQEIASALSAFQIGDVQPLHLIAAATRIMTRESEEIVDEQGHQVRVYTILRKDIEELFSAAALDLDATESFHAAMDEALALTPLSNIGFDSDNLISVIRSLGTWIASVFTSDIRISSYGDFDQMDASAKMDMDLCLFSQNIHVQVSLDNQTLSDEDRKLLLDRFHGDFSSYDHMLAVRLTLTDPEKPDNQLPSLAVGWMENEAGESRILGTVTSIREGETRELLTLMLEQKAAAAEDKLCREYSLMLGSLKGEIFRVIYSESSDTADSGISLIVGERSYSIAKTVESYDRKNFVPSSPLNLGSLSEAAYLNWVSEARIHILKQLGITLIRVPFEVINISDLLGMILN